MKRNKLLLLVVFEKYYLINTIEIVSNLFMLQILISFNSKYL